MYHIYCIYKLKIVVCLHRCHSASEYENHHTFNRKRSVSSISMTPRRKNLPEESISKEHITGLKWSVRLLGLQAKDFAINNEDITSKSDEGIMNKSIYICIMNKSIYVCLSWKQILNGY
jgi:hypothetical protein